ncbi:MAG TPA: NAD(P)H-binding protein [Saprospiraceae bacterium]|nr:NAD(P)H-binding protein [Saprospiraceae bacterium]
MKKLILFGASGNLGREIAKKAMEQGYDLTVVVRNAQKAEKLSSITPKFIIADITNPSSLANTLIL